MPREVKQDPWLWASEQLLTAQNLVLEMIASSRPLEDSLGALASFIDRLDPSGVSCVALADPEGRSLRLAAGPKLPAAFRESMDSWSIGPNCGACGTAAHRRERVVISDIETDPLFDGFRENLLAHGLRACWSSPILSSDGAVLGTLGVYHDRPYSPGEREVAAVERATYLARIAIERARYEAKLQAGREQFRALIENTSDVISILDVNGTIGYASPSIERVLGFHPKELVGTCGFSYFHPEDLASARKVFDRVLQQPGACFPIELRFRHKDGSWRVLDTIANNQTTDPAIAGIIVTGHDVTDRKATEEELISSQDRYHELFENANDIIYTHSLCGALTSLNRAGEVLTGYSRSEALGRNIADFIAPECQAIAREMIDRKIGGETKTTYEVEIVGKEGARILLEVSTRLIFQSGRPVAVQGIGRDITERRRLESHLLQTHKMEAIGRLAGGVAHDFNNLLTVIIGHSQWLLDQIPSGSQPRENAEEILLAANRAATLTNQLLAFSRSQIVQPVVVDMNILVTQLDPMLRRLIGEDIELKMEPTPDLWLTRADPGQVEQVILNLVINARDAMPEGGRLTVATANVGIGEDLSRTLPHCPGPGEYVLLTVSDSGCGIDEKIKAHIFEPFFTTKEVGKGTGLGLSTVYGVVTQGGGFISVNSPPGSGATFQIYFPRVEAGLFPAVVRQPVGAKRGTETILLVEDEAALRKMVGELLGRLGYTILEAADAESAASLARANEGRIDLLLTDLVMPLVNGRELARRLREQKTDLKVIFMSGYAADLAAEAGSLEPETAYLQKPFTPHALAAKVREALDGPMAPALESGPPPGS